MPTQATDTRWDELRNQADRAIQTEPTLAELFRQTIVQQPDFGCALAHRISKVLAGASERPETLFERFASAQLRDQDGWAVVDHVKIEVTSRMVA